MRYARYAGDDTRLADLMNAFAQTLYGNGNFFTLLSWCSSLSPTLRQKYPDLTIFLAGSLFCAGQPQDALSILENESAAAVEQSVFEENGTQQKIWQGRIAILKALIASRQGQIQSSLTFAQRGMEFLPETDLLWRANGVYALANAHSALAHREEVIHYLQQMIRISRSAGYLLLEVNTWLSNLLGSYIQVVLLQTRNSS